MNHPASQPSSNLCHATSGDASVLYLPYRPPFDFEGLLASYRACGVALLERFEPGRMHRVFAHGGSVARVTIGHDATLACLVVTVESSDPAVVRAAADKVRFLFDLDVDPAQIASRLGTDPQLRRLLSKYPGLRLATGWDPFEIAIGVILGQFVSVEWARTLLADFVDLLGRPSGLFADGVKIKLFPPPADVANADLTKLRTTLARKATLKAFARAVDDGTVSLDPAQDVAAFLKTVRTVKGIGPWSAQYIAMRALRDADSFPASDLILARALAHHPLDVIDQMSPWRGYAAALLWREYAQTLKKTNRRKVQT